MQGLLGSGEGGSWTPLSRRVSSGVTLPQGTWGDVWGICACHGGGLLALSGWGAGRLPHTLTVPVTPPQRMLYFQDTSLDTVVLLRAFWDDSACRSWLLAATSTCGGMAAPQHQLFVLWGLVGCWLHCLPTCVIPPPQHRGFRLSLPPRSFVLRSFSRVAPGNPATAQHQAAWPQVDPRPGPTWPGFCF